MSHRSTPAFAQGRRAFLRTFAFSAAAVLANRSLLRAATPSDGGAQHIFLLGDWGAAGNIEPQQQVAAAMTAYSRNQGISPSALFLLGDNFYGQLDGGSASPRWQTQFEDMYPKSAFGGPCYALLGNHDYNVEPAGKAEAQLAYAAAHPGSRWTMPSKWYRFDFPNENPLVTFISLDSNYQTPTADKLALTPEERSAQADWLKVELAKPRTTKFLIICGHHPLYSNAGDGEVLIQQWDALFRQHSAHLYFCGHIHDLEHLEFENHPTSFVVSGGGGTILRTGQGNKSSALNRFGRNVHGFTHLEIRGDQLVIRHLSSAGDQLHAFSKSAQGQVNIL